MYKGVQYKTRQGGNDHAIRTMQTFNKQIESTQTRVRSEKQRS